MMQLAVVICGRIGSGKSTATNFLVAEFSFKEVSFGRYIKHLAELNRTPSTRKELQDLGRRLFISRSASSLLRDAMEHFEVVRDDSVVFDGVRHPEILAEIRYAAKETIAVYLDANQEQRFHRSQTRHPSDWSSEDFLFVERHPVENDIGRLIEHCDLVVDASLPAAAVQNLLRERLAQCVHL